MRDHETPHQVTSREALGPLLKDAEDLLETVSILKYLIEEESEQEEIPISINEEVEEKEEPQQEPIEEPQEISIENGQRETEELVAVEVVEGDQTTINEVVSPSEEGTKVAEKLVKQSVSDLPSAIGVNERYLFINELFDGDGETYQIAIEQLNGFDHIQDAMKYVRDELSDKFNWDQEQESTISFYALIEKRYAA